MTNKQALDAFKMVEQTFVVAMNEGLLPKDAIPWDELTIVETALSQPANKMMLDAYNKLKEKMDKSHSYVEDCIACRDFIANYGEAIATESEQLRRDVANCADNNLIINQQLCDTIKQLRKERDELAVRVSTLEASIEARGYDVP